MNNEVLTVQYINAKNCFLHLSLQQFRSLIGPSVFCLKLLTKSGRDLYFSANPIPSPLVNANSVGISQTFAQLLDLKEKELVIISPLYNLGSVQSISVTPKSESDFEILHSSALTVESSLLNQLRIVWPRQTFPIWVSANIYVTLVVDSISPSIKYGRLEEYSEVVVATVIPKNGIKKKTTSVPPQVSTVLTEEFPERKKLQFRCVPKRNLSHPSCKFCLHPYVVFVRKDSLPEWAFSAIEPNKRVAWRLTKCSDDTRSVIVSIAFSDGAPEPEEIPGFSTLFASDLLKNHINVDFGQKVFLEQIITDNTTDVSGVLVSSSENAEKLTDEVHNAFAEALSAHSELLLNTKAPYVLKNGATVQLTLRPLDTTWGFVSSNKLSGLSINVNKYVSDAAYSETQVADQVCTSNSIPSYEEIIEQGRIALELSFSLHSKSRTKRFNDNVIYIGRGGCGKTSLVTSLLEKLRGPPFYIHTEYLSCCSVKGKRVEALSKYLTEILQRCSRCEPSVIFLDDIDFLASVSEENTEAGFHTNRISNKVVELIEGCQLKNSILIVATAKSLDKFNPQVFSSKGKCLFTTVINIPNLEKNDRLIFLKKIFTSGIHKVEEDIDYDSVSSQTEGYTPLDLKKLCDKAVFEAWQRKVEEEDELIITKEDVTLALNESKPSSFHQVNFYKGPKMSWDDIGGLKSVKEKLIEVVCWPTMYPEILSQCPVKPQTGVLLYGAPGTGKTLIASALAAESKMNFISIKGPELMSKYIGESEEGVRKLFEKAQAARPCLLFFDEFDSLAPRRGQDQTGVTDRVVNQLLTALDGVDPMSGVWVLAATSRPDLIDPAVLRPGRIGISVRCPLPHQDDRLEIIKSICSKINVSEDVDVKCLSEVTEGFTGADIKGLFTSAQIKAIDVLQDETGLFNIDVNVNDELPVFELQNEHLLEALKELRPSLSESEKMRYKEIYDQFEMHTPVKIEEQKVTHA